MDGLSYGPVRLHLPGVRFTNRNWPYVKRAGLRAMLALLVGLYPLELALRALLPSLPALAYPMVSLLALLGGLFGAMTAAAVRHADPPASAKAPVLYAVALVVALAAVLALGGTGGYGVWTGAVQQKLPGSWRAQYAFFEGTRSGSLWGKGDLELAVQTQSGTLAVTVTGAGGSTLLEETTSADAAWRLDDPGPVTLTLQADGHSGGFSASYAGPG